MNFIKPLNNVKCNSSVSLSNVTVTTSLNSKTRIIENQTITLKRRQQEILTEEEDSFDTSQLDLIDFSKKRRLKNDGGAAESILSDRDSFVFNYNNVSPVKKYRQGDVEQDAKHEVLKENEYYHFKPFEEIKQRKEIEESELEEELEAAKKEQSDDHRPVNDKLREAQTKTAESSHDLR